MALNSTIEKHVMPLVGKVKMPGFQHNRFGNVMSLQMKMIKHCQNRNAEKLKMYLAFCVQEWPVFSDCPIPKEVIGDAINVIKTS
jgi:hypothetical protein